MSRYSSIVFPALKTMFVIKKELRRHGHYMGMKSEEEVSERLARLSAQQYAGNFKAQAILSEEMGLIGSLIGGRYRNYFIETEELLDFLITTEVRDKGNFFRICDELHTDSAMIGIDPMSREIFTGNTITRFTGVIHAPGITRSIMFSQTIVLNKPDKMTNLYVNDGDEWALFNHDNLHDCLLRKFYPLILNMFFYIDCFPDCIREGAPNDCIQEHSPITGSESISITTHHSLVDRAGPSPHLRRGHFRFLGSEHFTKKRGQTVFVRSSFVKGHAETVEDVGSGRTDMITSPPASVPPSAGGSP